MTALNMATGTNNPHNTRRKHHAGNGNGKGMTMYIKEDDLVKIQDALISRDPIACAVAESIIVSAKDKRAGPGLIARARHEYADGSDDDLEIDDDAGTSGPDDGSGIWVQAWVWLAAPTCDFCDRFLVDGESGCCDDCKADPETDEGSD